MPRTASAVWPAPPIYTYIHTYAHTHTQYTHTQYINTHTHNDRRHRVAPPQEGTQVLAVDIFCARAHRVRRQQYILRQAHIIRCCHCSAAPHPGYVIAWRILRVCVCVFVCVFVCVCVCVCEREREREREHVLTLPLFCGPQPPVQRPGPDSFAP